MQVKPMQQENKYQNNCSMPGVEGAVNEETCLKCGFKCIEGGV